MPNARLDETQAGIKIARRNISNLRYADDITLMAESEELKNLLIKVKEESEKAGLKLNIQKTKTIASSPITKREDKLGTAMYLWWSLQYKDSTLGPEGIDINLKRRWDKYRSCLENKVDGPVTKLNLRDKWSSLKRFLLFCLYRIPWEGEG